MLSNIAKQRLQTICNTSNGFQIAEQDLKLRGGGDVIGVRQSGEKLYKTFDINDPNVHELLPKFLEQISPISQSYDKNSLVLRIFQKL
jgi:ATP-dependent DNA helicase RecG